MAGAPTRRRFIVRSARLAVVALVLAAALSSCRSGVGSTPTTTPFPSATSEETPSPTAEPTTPPPTDTPAPDEPSPSDPSAGSVTIITLEVVDGLVQASGILPGAVESDGECTLTISRDGVTRSGSVAATSGRESTYCGLVSVSAAGLEPGAWDAVLSYRSPTTAGESMPMQVQVP